jgi:hypothetical protein
MQLIISGSFGVSFPTVETLDGILIVCSHIHWPEISKCALAFEAFFAKARLKRATGDKEGDGAASSEFEDTRIRGVADISTKGQIC